MFSNATNFNQPLNKWNVSNGIDFICMFSDATNFNQDVASWNLTNDQRLSCMFNNAISFNQDLSSWNVSENSQAGMFYESNIKEEFKPIPSKELEEYLKQLNLNDDGDY
tara:strand:- start:322 stop:648 length:327 start_codon:yes stop_codon:yes gene_type:complete